MPRVFRAQWVVPVAQPPVRRGWVAVAGGRIVAVGGESDPPPPGEVHEIAGAILPALVNAHTHLELSYLRGRISPSGSFGRWVREVMAVRREHPNPADAQILEAAREAIAAAVSCGTGLIGDVSNTLVTVPLLRDAAVAAHVFYELTGFNEPDPVGRVREARFYNARFSDGDIRLSVAPHAPYSVSAGLFRAIHDSLDPGAVTTVHLGEPPEELELLRHGAGDLRNVLEELGRWPDGWAPPGVGPVEYLEQLGVLDPRMLVVHGVQFDQSDLDRLRTRAVTIVSCPRSNLHVGVGSPPLERFYQSELQVAFGTDSLASVSDLNLFSELREARRIAPGVSASRLLEGATLTGARALRFERELGSIEAAKRAALIAVEVPAGEDDVEEYLVQGVAPEQITWLRTGATPRYDTER